MLVYASVAIFESWRKLFIKETNFDKHSLPKNLQNACFLSLLIHHWSSTHYKTIFDVKKFSPHAPPHLLHLRAKEILSGRLCRVSCP